MVAALFAIGEASGMGMTGLPWEAWRVRGRLWNFRELARLWYMIVAKSDSGEWLVCGISVHNVIENHSHNPRAL